MMAKRRTVPPKDKKLYRQIWRIVDGAVLDALAHHPEYLAEGVSTKVVRLSINKRVVGAVMGFAEEAESRSGDSPAADNGDASQEGVAAGGLLGAPAGAGSAQSGPFSARPLADWPHSGKSDATGIGDTYMPRVEPKKEEET